MLGVGGEHNVFLVGVREEESKVETWGCKDQFGFITGVDGKPQIAFKKKSGKVRFALQKELCGYGRLGKEIKSGVALGLSIASEDACHLEKAFSHILPSLIPSTTKGKYSSYPHFSPEGMEALKWVSRPQLWNFGRDDSLLFSSMPGLYSWDAQRTLPPNMTFKNVSRHCWMTPMGAQSLPVENYYLNNQAPGSHELGC